MVKKNSLVIQSAAVWALALTAATSGVISTKAVAAEDKMQKCYGIVKAGKNDCPTNTSSCASSSTVDGQGDAFILLPKGTCEKIVGGSLENKNPPKGKK